MDQSTQEILRKIQARTGRVPTTKGRAVPPKQEELRLLIVGDAVAHTGFARVVHNIANNLYQKVQLAVLGINYFGDPHGYPYMIFPAAPANVRGADFLGCARLPGLLNSLQPHVVLFINDPWNVKTYLEIMEKYEEETNTSIRKLAYMPVDGLNIRSVYAEGLNSLDHAILYTQFGLDVLRKSGMDLKDVTIIPHGVDTSVYHPLDKHTLRKEFFTDPKTGKEMLDIDDTFIFFCLQRNTPRKRMDLMIEYFAEFAKDKPDNVKFMYHGALRDEGYDIVDLTLHYNIHDRLILTDDKMTSARGVSEQTLNKFYNMADAYVTTTDGEGWCLPAHEAMATGLPVICPDWAALGEWARPAARLVPCTTFAARPNLLNTIGGIADRAQFVAAMNDLYYSKELREDMAKKSLALATEDRFKWSTIAAQFEKVIRG